MKVLKSKKGIFLLIFVLLITFGCGDGEEEDISSKLRYVNVNPDFSVYNVVDYETGKKTKIKYGESSGYKEVETGEFVITGASKPSPISDTDYLVVRIEPNKGITIVISGTSKKIDFSSLEYDLVEGDSSDDFKKPSKDFFKIRFFNAVKEGDFDIFVLNKGYSIDSVNALISGLKYKGTSSYFIGNMLDDSGKKTSPIVYVVDKESKNILVRYPLKKIKGSELYTCIIREKLGGGSPFSIKLIEDDR